MVVPAPVFGSKNDTLTALPISCNVVYFITQVPAGFNSWLFLFKSTLLMRKMTGLIMLLLILNSCAHVVVVDSKAKKNPPGQVKKVTGSQSAKQYAPGHQNKKN